MWATGVEFPSSPLAAMSRARTSLAVFAKIPDAVLRFLVLSYLAWVTA
jgi:hypothetical protein